MPYTAASLNSALEAENREKVRACLKNKVDIFQRKNELFDFTYAAYWPRDIAQTQLLFDVMAEKGIVLNRDSWGELEYDLLLSDALDYQHKKLIESLIVNAPDQETREMLKAKALRLAISLNKRDMIVWLLTFGADPYRLVSIEFKAPQNAFSAYTSFLNLFPNSDFLDMIREAKVIPKNPKGSLPLIVLATLHYRNEFVIEIANSLCTTNSELRHAYNAAVECGNWETVRFLHARGVNKLTNTTVPNPRVPQRYQTQYREVTTQADAISEQVKSIATAIKTDPERLRVCLQEATKAYLRTDKWWYYPASGKKRATTFQDLLDDNKQNPISLFKDKAYMAKGNDGRDSFSTFVMMQLLSTYRQELRALPQKWSNGVSPSIVISLLSAFITPPLIAESVAAPQHNSSAPKKQSEGIVRAETKDSKKDSKEEALSTPHKANAEFIWDAETEANFERQVDLMIILAETSKASLHLKECAALLAKVETAWVSRKDFSALQHGDEIIYKLKRHIEFVKCSNSSKALGERRRSSSAIPQSIETGYPCNNGIGSTVSLSGSSIMRGRLPTK